LSITLNGSTVTNPSFYAPTSAGEGNSYYLESGGYQKDENNEYLLDNEGNRIPKPPKWTKLVTTINYTSTTSTYYLIGYTSSPSETARTLSNVYARSTVYVNSSGYLYADKVYNAVWNDYAEYRKTDTI